MPIKHRMLWTAFAATLALAACGGSDDDDTPAPTPTPSPSPAPSPSPSPGIDRIEPLDTSKSAIDIPAKTENTATRQLPAGAVPAQVALGPLPVVKTLAPEVKGVPLSIGQGRALPTTASAEDLGRLLRWNALADGSRVAAVSFSAEGAQGLRLGLLAEQVPEGTTLRFYGDSDSSVVEMTATELLAQRDANVSAGDAATVWSPSVEGSTATLEVQLPAGTSPDALSLAVPQLSHLLVTVDQLARSPLKAIRHIGNSESCNRDIVCAPSADPQSRSVAKMLFTTDSGGTALCTGTLLNDTRNSRTPYFLTAAHCVASQAEASSLETYWFFRSAACGSSTFDERAWRLPGGAQLRFTNAATDTSLLQLNAAPPANVVYAGSYFGSGLTRGLGVMGVHHPAGDLQKISLGNVTGYSSCSFTGDGSMGCSLSNYANGSMMMVRWTQGVTERGSSGSAIFGSLDNKLYVVGNLSGGASSCGNPDGEDHYGRFDKAFAQGINRWLAP